MASSLSLPDWPTAALAVSVVIGLSTTLCSRGGRKVRRKRGEEPPPPYATLDDRPAFPTGHWRTDPSSQRPIPRATTGTAALVPVTVPEQVRRACAAGADETALVYANGGGHLTWEEYGGFVDRTAAALIATGLQPGQGVSIVGFNSPEWVVANLAAISAGGLSAGIYATNSSEACVYVAEHSKSAAVFVEGDDQLLKFASALAKDPQAMPNLRTLVGWGGDGVRDGRKMGSGGRISVVSWESFLNMGDDGDSEKELQRRKDALRPEQCCTLIYTSGTTGTPKAVMLSHDNVTWTCASVLRAVPDWGTRSCERLVSFLPLSHIAAQMIDIYAPIAAMAENRRFPTSVHFAKPDALKGSLRDTLKDARPTVFFGVPRVWEKMEDALRSAGAKAGPVRRAVAAWARAKCLAKVEADQRGDPEPLGYALGGKYVMDGVRAELGLDQCRHFFTGAAPITQDTLQFFAGLDIPLCELYGMSESSGPQTMNLPDDFAWGTCGAPLPGMEVRIDRVVGTDREGRERSDPEGEGEVCFRGRNVMLGYMGDAERSADAVDGDGWLHSGDLGRLDARGRLIVTGRLKELIIGAGGENIAPVPIEERVKALCPALSQAVLVGDRRKYLVMLVTLKEGEKGADRPAVQAAIDRYNADFAVSNAQRVQKFHICEEDFTEEGGELTATQKLKRTEVLRKHADAVDGLYEEDAKCPPPSKKKPQLTVETTSDET